MPELLIFSAFALLMGLFMLMLARRAISAMDDAVRSQQQTFERIAVHLKARDLYEVKAHDEPPSAPVESEGLADPALGGFEDMRRAGLDPEEPGHLAIWNTTRGNGAGIGDIGEVP